MYLKRLDMCGFKSFADKLSLEFNSGITAIVGPNGSGKSNITDAIRWVMGEQSVKSLRGSRMEDVIFAGTATRKPLNFAEVSLTLDNSSGIFVSPYTEITVTRRVYRSGDGEYFINKTPCRLKDIHELLMDTGLGRDGYSVVSQGQIDAILSAKSEDRRQIFEEAAGISKYKYRKTEAVRKLNATEENLVRVRDILAELASRIGPLETQSKKARTYLDLREKLKKLEVNLALLSIEKLQTVQKESETLLATVQEELAADTHTLETQQAAEQSMHQERKTRDYELEQVRSLLHGMELSVKEWEGENALLLQNVENTTARCSGIDSEIELLQAETAQIEKYEAGTLRTIADLAVQHENALIKLAAGRERLDELSLEISKQNDAINHATADAAKIQGEQDDAHRRLEELNDGDFQSRVAELESEVTETIASRQKTEEERADVQKHLTALQLQITDINDKLRTCAEQKPQLDTKITALKNEYNAYAHECSQKSSRRAALADMERNMEGYGKGVRAVMQAHLSADIHDVLSKLITVEKPYITAIETAMGGALQNIVVGDMEDAKIAIEYLKQNHLGRATFLPIASITGRRLSEENALRNTRGFIALGCDLITCDNRYTEIVRSLVGSVAVMDTIDNAIAAARKFRYAFKIVTTDGELFLRGGSMSGGSHATQGQLLGRSTEIEQLDKACEALERKMDKTEDAIDDANERLSALIQETDTLRRRKAEADSTLLQLEGRLHICENERVSTENRLSRLYADLESARARIENADAERQRLLLAEQTAAEHHTAGLQEIERQRLLLKELMHKREQQGDAVTAMQVAVTSLDKDAEVTQARQASLKEDVLKIAAKILTKQQERATLENAVTATNLRIRNKQMDIADAQKRITEFQAEIEKLLADKDDTDTEITKLRTDIEVQHEKINALNGETMRIEIRLTKAQEDLDSTVTHLWDEYELTYSSAMEYRAEIGGITAAKEEAVRLRRAIRALGSVNIDAIEEYATVHERHTFLSTQVADLEKAKAELTAIITDMTRVMTDTFAEQFRVIAATFTQTFQALFGGGTARLSLSDPNDILESGIEIDVQPPGKKLQSLTLLSGGEKAFTAIAILFAVLQVRPAPFCILDEIESALDDHNITGFANYLRNYAETQFVIVTHRRGTMEAADVLYGVTMQEKGISKLLTMHLD